MSQEFLLLDVENTKIHCREVWEYRQYTILSRVIYSWEAKDKSLEEDNRGKNERRKIRQVLKETATEYGDEDLKVHGRGAEYAIQGIQLL